MVTINKQVAVEPFKTRANQVKVQSGFAESATRDGLLPLKVVFSSMDTTIPYSIDEGKTVWVRAELSIQALAKRVYEIDGKSFILIPLEQVVLVG